MDPKQTAQRNKQRERQQRGHSFQEEVRKSWSLVPNIWQINIKDGAGGTRPADRIVLTEEVRILAELKRTAGQSFSLSFLRPNQIRGLIDFDQVITRNYGLVLVSFLNEKKDIDAAYAFRLTTALKYMQDNSTHTIHLTQFQDGIIPVIEMPRLHTSEPTYDMGRVAECHKYL